MKVQLPSSACRYPVVSRPFVEIPQLLKEEVTKSRMTEGEWVTVNKSLLLSHSLAQETWASFSAPTLSSFIHSYSMQCSNSEPTTYIEFRGSVELDMRRVFLTFTNL